MWKLFIGVCRSRFTAIEEGAVYLGVVHCHLGWSCQLWVLPEVGGKAS